MGIKESIQSMLPSTRRFVNRRLDDQDTILHTILSDQQEIIKRLAYLDDQNKKVKSQVEKIQNGNTQLTQIVSNQSSAITSMREDVKETKRRFDSQNSGLANIRKDLTIIRDGQRKTIAKPILQLSYDLTEHCNLNCAGCDHFSPIAEPIITDVKEFDKDLKRLAELFESEIRYIHLVGGEPLLHPDINCFMKIARDYFPTGMIRVVSNGILLIKQDESFWQTAAENQISIEITPYPISIPINEIRKLADRYCVRLVYFGRDDIEINEKSYKEMRHMPLDIDGNGDATSNWLECYHANNCICLKHGKIYPCTICPSIEHFNKRFGLNLVISKNDYVDIHSDVTAEDILAFLATPIPFCRYCNTKMRKTSDGWHTSTGDILEWT